MLKFQFKIHTIGPITDGDKIIGSNKSGDRTMNCETPAGALQKKNKKRHTFSKFTRINGVNATGDRMTARFRRRRFFEEIA